MVLLKKTAETGQWLVATSTEGICKIKLNDKNSVRSVTQGPKQGVHYQAIDVLSNAQRDALMAQAEAMVGGAGTAGVRTLTYSQGSFKTTARRYMALLGSMPLIALRLLRWCLQTVDEKYRLASSACLELDVSPEAAQATVPPLRALC